LIDISLKLPVIVEVIDTSEKIEAVLPLVTEMVNEGLVLVTDVTVIKYGKELTQE
jgi:PII-like signaling protein